MSDGLDNYPGLKGLVEATELSTEKILPTSLFQAFLKQLELNGISLNRGGRLELLELIGKTVRFRSGTFRSVWPSYRESGAKVILRSELIGEFEKQGLSTEDSLRAAEIFFEMVEKGELGENHSTCV